MKETVETLIEEIVGFQNQLNEWGRKSVPIIIQCGERLKKVKYKLKVTQGYGHWGKCCQMLREKVRLSQSSIDRYIKSWEASIDPSTVTKLRSIERTLNDITLDEWYQLIGVYVKTPSERKGSKPTSKSSDDKDNKNGGNPSNNNGDKKDENPPKDNQHKKDEQPPHDNEDNPPIELNTDLEKCRSHIGHLVNLLNKTYTDEETRELLRLTLKIVNWHNDHRPPRVVLPESDINTSEAA